MHNYLKLQLQRVEIPMVDEYKFLGIILDKKLTSIPHLKYLRTKWIKTLQFLRVVAHKNWGANRQTLLKLYRTLIRSKLNYGNFIYQSTIKYLKIFNTTYHKGLRGAPGTFTTSVESLCVETN